ncbi:LysR family transcriptional regulator [Alteromonas pelagimontana]|uniref:LysR family transcriptional regulator n=1 Tax=Alteromonas pelagimontana TaxID=1858656 RepID=A0A6M4MD64_9ALTE|nr:LysR family transcriptional regulator [Alteromonas pelagimontana]QJR81073.1 LysR family transcriptional regulator [Alteromonas pelagimontana]
MINIKHLRAFIAVAAELHFTRAAERVCLTQPALSSLIQQLEQDFGVQLVRRHTRQVELTEAGEGFLSTAEKLVSDFEQAIHDVKTYKSIRRGRVDIAAVPSVCGHFLPDVLKKFSDAYPDIRLNVKDCAGQEIVDSIKGKLIDFGISYTQTDKDLEAIAITEDALVVVCKRSHSFAQKEYVTWEDLADEKLIAMDKGTTIRTLIDSTAIAQNMKLDIVLEPRLMPTALSYAESGIGVTILPSLGVVKNLPQSLIRKPLNNPTIKREISLISQRGRTLSPAAKILKSFVLGVDLKTI